MAPQLALIEASSRTPFEKQVWALLCQIPRGSFSTYGIMAAHLKSSPRAVGNALRRNPFAPEVPCHRVVATGGALGGFKGKWPKDGEGITIDEKRTLLKGEGVRWNEKGKVIGTPFAETRERIQHQNQDLEGDPIRCFTLELQNPFRDGFASPIYDAR
ncbi:hypothetical protein ACHAO9_008087 [Fusarium lateritium]